MKLISCDGCGLVYDQDKLKFADLDEIIHAELEDITDYANWNGDGYTPKISCRICKGDIEKE